MALTLPVVNGSNGVWGSILNGILTDLDARLAALDTETDTGIADLTSRLATVESEMGDVGGGGGGGFTVATSSTRPPVTVGQMVMDTNTGFLWYGASVNGVATLVPMPGSWVGKARATTTQSMGNGSPNKIIYNSISTDRLNGFSAGSSRYTATVPGTYEFTGGSSWTANTVGYRYIGLWLNGVALNSSTTYVTPVGSGIGTTANLRPAIVLLNVGDYVEIAVLHNGGATLSTDVTTSIQPSLNVKYLGYATA